MVDYRRFLAREEELVLPWGGGRRVAAPGRRLELAAPPERPGWWTFRVVGRRAEALGPAEPPDLSALRAARGHLDGRRLVPDDAQPRELLFLPGDEPARFSPARARRWHDGAWLLEETDLEGEAEEPARQAFEDRRGLAGVKHVSASLRAAFAYATLAREAQGLQVPWHPLEHLAGLAALADGGPELARVALLRHAAERRRLGPPRTWREARDRALDARAEARAERALARADAELLGARLLDEGRLLEVRYRFLHARFSSIVRADTLQVVDAGVCLSGEDAQLTLESLPGAIREGVRSGQLLVTRAWEEDPP